MPKKNPQVPYYQIKQIISREHVGTPLAEIRADIRRRCEAAGGTEKDCRDCVTYAAKCHIDNRVMYLEVQGGHLGPKSKERRAALKRAAQAMG
jgi:hypothetical protein